MAIKKNFIVAKRNVLNEIRANSMTLQELRFFSIYLSKINPQDIETRVVRFSISDFQRIMELDNDVRISYLKNITNNLLCKVVNVPTETGGYSAFQLFKKCKVDVDEHGNGYIEIDAHDEALPLMFEFKDKYFTYQLWNALQLKSSNQLRMYEILKQYEKVGERIISIDELKTLLGIGEKEYKRFGDFNTRVLEVCQEALTKYTDISFTYEPTGKKGRGGKILNLKFTIKKNKNYIDKLSLENFLGKNSEKNTTIIDEDNNDYFEFYLEACNNEFSIEEIRVLYDLIIKILPPSILSKTEIYDYLKRKYDELLWRSQKQKINKRFNYLKAIIEVDMNF